MIAKLATHKISIFKLVSVDELTDMSIAWSQKTDFLAIHIGPEGRKPVFWVCEQQRRRPACASAQSDQLLCYCYLESNISKLATSKISIFQLVSVAEQAGLSETLEDRFSHKEAQIYIHIYEMDGYE